MELKSTASALGLHSYHLPPPNRDVYRRFYDAVIALFAERNIEATYIGVRGEGWPKKLGKFKGKTHKRLLETGFANVDGVSVYANPKDSDAPSFDRFAYASIGFSEFSNETYIGVVVNEVFISFCGEEYRSMYERFLDLFPWDFGYGFSDDVDKYPEFHILGGGYGELSAEEESALQAWYASSPETRLQKLRDVYPKNFVSEKHLETEIAEDMTLRKWIDEHSSTDLVRLTDYGLHLWIVDDQERDHFREQLGKMGALISIVSGAGSA